MTSKFKFNCSGSNWCIDIRDYVTTILPNTPLFHPILFYSTQYTRCFQYCSFSGGHPSLGICNYCSNFPGRFLIVPNIPSAIRTIGTTVSLILQNFCNFLTSSTSLSKFHFHSILIYNLLWHPFSDIWKKNLGLILNVVF